MLAEEILRDYLSEQEAGEASAPLEDLPPDARRDLRALQYRPPARNLD